MANAYLEHGPKAGRWPASAGVGVASCALLLLSGACAPATPSGLGQRPASVDSRPIGPTQPTPNARLREVAPSVDQIGEAAAVHVERTWSGYSHVPRRRESYPLTRTGDQFTGTGTVTADAISSASGRRSIDGVVSIPADMMSRALQRLSDISIIRGNYKSRDEWTDDHPETQILVTLGDEDAFRFFSTSQGALQIPWGVEHGGTEYIVHGDGVARVIGELEPYLLRSTLRDLTKALETEVMDADRRRAEDRQRATQEALRTPSASVRP